MKYPRRFGTLEENLYAEQYALVEELLDTARYGYATFSKWDNEFLLGCWEKLQKGGQNLSVKQQNQLRRIEKELCFPLYRSFFIEGPPPEDYIPEGSNRLISWFTMSAEDEANEEFFG